jgi:hypothetical protein
MINFEATNFEELQQEAQNKAHEISIATITAVCKGIEENADVVHLGILSSLNMDISVTSDNYLEALELNIPRATEAEEYELCARAIKHINDLKQNKS